MEILNKHYPREYLALKISYCRKYLEKLPAVSLHEHNLGGKLTTRVYVGKHRYYLDSDLGKKGLDLMRRREQLERELELYEAIWKYKYNDELPPEIEARSVKRTLWLDVGKPVLLNKAYFDSLEPDANTEYEKPKDYEFDGTLYRSAAEREIAIFYTDMGIPFKYEPKVFIKGLADPIFPDFVMLIKELDNCKFQEHYGMKNSSSYLRSTSVKYSNYATAGLEPELDMIYTHDTDEMPFDIRELTHKLNTAIYSTVIRSKGQK